MTTPYLVTKSHKSVGIAILLTLLFGPIGLFYASVSGGLIMTFLVPLVLGGLFIAGILQNNLVILSWSLGLFIFFGLTYYLISIIWAIQSVIDYNNEIDKEVKLQLDHYNRFHEKDNNQFTVNINQKTLDTSISGQEKIEETTKPNLRDWLKNNPSKGINDYYAKFGT